MKKLIAIAALALMPLTGFAAGGGHNPFVVPANVDVTNNAAIQRGAKYFVNYCMGCHSAKYVRYQLMKQVGLSEDQIKENLIFDGSKPGGLMTIAMQNNDAGNWFGAPAPDLTLECTSQSGQSVDLGDASATDPCVTLPPRIFQEFNIIDATASSGRPEKSAITPRVHPQVGHGTPVTRRKLQSDVVSSAGRSSSAAPTSASQASTIAAVFFSSPARQSSTPTRISSTTAAPGSRPRWARKTSAFWSCSQRWRSASRPNAIHSRAGPCAVVDFARDPLRLGF